jgi:hypothetical protein
LASNWGQSAFGESLQAFAIDLPEKQGKIQGNFEGPYAMRSASYWAVNGFRKTLLSTVFDNREFTWKDQGILGRAEV